jgi:hypothetical protein
METKTVTLELTALAALQLLASVFNGSSAAPPYGTASELLRDWQPAEDGSMSIVGYETVEGEHCVRLEVKEAYDQEPTRHVLPLASLRRVRLQTTIVANGEKAEGQKAKKTAKRNTSAKDPVTT